MGSGENLRKRKLKLQCQHIPYIRSVFKIHFKSNASIKPKKIYLTYIKATNIQNIFLSCCKSFWQINITGCMTQSPKHDLAKWSSTSGHRHKKK